MLAGITEALRTRTHSEWAGEKRDTGIQAATSVKFFVDQSVQTSTDFEDSDDVRTDHKDLEKPGGSTQVVDFSGLSDEHDYRPAELHSDELYENTTDKSPKRAKKSSRRKWPHHHDDDDLLLSEATALADHERTVMREEMRTRLAAEPHRCLSGIVCEGQIDPDSAKCVTKVRKTWHGARPANRVCAVAVFSHQRRAL